MRKVLLIEDDVSVVHFIRKGLIEENFDVAVSLSGKTGIQMCMENAYNIVLLDIMLPDCNGIDVCKELRSKGVSTPILFLTALSASDNVALGLNSGADDYLVKPFKFNELIARINAVLRRTSGRSEATSVSSDVYEVANLIVDDQTKTVKRDGQLISLTATEYRLLLTLIQSKGKVFSRIELLDIVWGASFNVTTNVVDVYMNYLRKKIDAAHDVKLLHTVIGMGYVLRAQ
ncbi:MAG: response regulator transcription factor [Chitinophagales bacterium]|nr:response regulator transcription factor [Chitinophagales bacterium]